MRLAAIKLAGFKSYVDPTTIELPQNITVIVGPNGCGKSNVIDAIRLVIGESQASQLRGVDLESMIFDGSESRAPAGRASVELLFENEDFRVRGPFSQYSEISLKRELYRDAPSKFYLNGKRCRRRDIRDLVLSAGFSARGYAVIPQGLIAQLVVAKPEETRTHIEDAAGVSKYRDRRRDTEKKIQSAIQNLERIKDHADELQRQIAHLERQSREAARFTDLKAKERLLQSKLLALAVQKVNAELEVHQSQIDDLTLTLRHEQEKLDSKSTEIEAKRVQDTELSDEFHEIQGQSYQARAQLSQLEEQIGNRERKISELKNEVTDLEQRIKRDGQEINSTKQELTELRIQYMGLVKSRDRAQTEVTTAQTEFEKARTTNAHEKAKWEQFIQSYSTKERNLEFATAKLEKLTNEFATTENEIEDLGSVAQMPPESDEITRLENALAKHQTDFEDRLTQLRQVHDKLKQFDDEDSQDDLQRQQLQTALHTLGEQRSALNTIIENGLGIDTTAERDSTLQAAGLTQFPRLGEQIETEKGWESALETLLDDSISAFVVSSLKDSLPNVDCEREQGFALVEPSTGSKGGGQSIESVILKGAEYVAALHPEAYVTDTLEEAMELRETIAEGATILTKSAILLGKHWLKLPSAYAVKTSVLECRTQLDELNVEFKAKESALGDLLQKISQRKTARVKASEVGSNLQDEVAQIQAAMAKERLELEEVNTKHAALVQQRKNSIEQRGRLSERKQSLADEITTTQEGINTLEEELNELGTERECLDQRQQANDKRVNVCLQQERTAREKHHALESSSIEMKAKIALLETSLQRASLDVQERSVRIELAAKESEVERQALQEQHDRLQGATNALSEVESKLRTVRQRREVLQHVLRECLTEENQFRLSTQAKQQELFSYRERVVESTSKREHLVEEINKLHYDLDELDKLLLPEDQEEKLLRSLTRTRTRLDNLGAVNLAAQSDLDRMKDEYETVNARVLDLQTSHELLAEAMVKIDDESLNLFLETLNRANSDFQDIFKRLFGGGSAQLRLIGDDPLTSGVLMHVSPPGKQVKTINQLSDGERALTALAFIFAMFRLNPSPVCILDEVDAPLDEHNVFRFVKLIQEMSQEIQFLVISHDRVTMQHADSLIGVTMEESGVSRFVSVDMESHLAEAVGNTPELGLG